MTKVVRSPGIDRRALLTTLAVLPALSTLPAPAPAQTTTVRDLLPSRR